MENKEFLEDIYNQIEAAFDLDGEVNIQINRNKRAEVSVKVANKKIIVEGDE